MTPNDLDNMLTIRDMRLFLVDMKILLKFTGFPTLRIFFISLNVDLHLQERICCLVNI